MYVWSHLPLSFPLTAARRPAPPVTRLETGGQHRRHRGRAGSSRPTCACRRRGRRRRRGRADPAHRPTAARCLRGRPAPTSTWSSDAAPTRQYSLCGDPADRHLPDRHPARRRPAAAARCTSTTRCRQATPSGSAARATTSPLAPSPALPVHRRRHRDHPDPADGRGGGGRRRDWRLVYGGRHRASMAFLDELARTATGSRVAPQDETGPARPRRAARHAASRTPWSTAAAPSRCSRPSSSAARPGRTARCTWSGSPRAGRRAGAQPRRSRWSWPAADLTLTVPPDRSILDVGRGGRHRRALVVRRGHLRHLRDARSSTAVPDHRDSVLTEDERRADDCMMICVSRSCTDRLVLDL